MAISYNGLWKLLIDKRKSLFLTQNQGGVVEEATPETYVEDIYVK